VEARELRWACCFSGSASMAVVVSSTGLGRSLSDEPALGESWPDIFCWWRAEELAWNWCVYSVVKKERALLRRGGGFGDLVGCGCSCRRRSQGLMTSLAIMSGREREKKKKKGKQENAKTDPRNELVSQLMAQASSDSLSPTEKQQDGGRKRLRRGKKAKETSSVLNI
jgi:hypothetical protein